MRMDEHIKRLIQKHTLEASRMSGQEALERYEMAYTQARELGNAFTIRACAANLGAMYVSLGKKEEAQKGLKYLSEAVPPEGVSDCVSNGDLYFNIGLGCEVVGLLERAHSNMELAWEEYRRERDNVAMEITALKKLLQVSQTRERYDDAIRWCRQLEEMHIQAKRPVDQLMVMQQRVTLQKRKGNEGLSGAVEDCCQLANEIQQQGKLTVEMRIQMAVMLAHFKLLQAAREYLEKADDLLEVEHSGSLQKAVVLQNLGTLCNCLDDWEVSLEYHRRAAAIYQRYASLPPDPSSPIQPLAAVRCQGHCVANHAYALAKLEKVDEAREFFSKAKELAAQCGDVDTKWQMEEALGAVHFRLACEEIDLPSPRDTSRKVYLSATRLKHLERSLECYKTALMDLATGKVAVQDRVLEKYTMVKTFKDKNVAQAQPGQMTQLYNLPTPPTTIPAETIKETTTENVPEKAPENAEESSTDSDEGGDEVDEESDDDESGESTSEDGEDEESLQLGKTVRNPAEEDEDREQVNALYQAQLGDGGTLQGTDKLRVKADIHVQQHASSSAESVSSEDDDSEEDSEDESSDESSDESDKEEDKKAKPLPPVPTESPPETLLPSGTYENPKSPVERQIDELYGVPHSRPRPRPGLHGSTNYADIDFDATAKKKSGELVLRSERRARPNFFVSTSDDEENGMTAKQRTHAGPSKGGRDDSDYEEMEVRPSSPRGQPAHRSRQADEMGESYLSHGQEKQKESKTCTVM